MRNLFLMAAGVALFLAALGNAAHAERIKELVEVEGVRDNPLVGYGLVVGLEGTGDDASSGVVRRSLAQLIKHLGTTIPVTEIKAKNVAAVMVTATLPPFARSGSTMDVTVSSIGTAKSLAGGTLIATPLKGADLGVYALAQGSLSLGGFAVSGQSGSRAAKNHATAGRIPAGAIVERDAPSVMPRGRVVLLLRQADFTTASRIATAIDKQLAIHVAQAEDPGTVSVMVPASWNGRVPAFIAGIEAVEVQPDSRGKVVIDERTGTIVVGANVTLGPAAIAHGDITVNVSEKPAVSQPGALAAGNTVVAPQTDIQVHEDGGQMKVVGRAATVGDVAAALNALGVKARDLVSILQALAAAGALRAEIVTL